MDERTKSCVFRFITALGLVFGFGNDPVPQERKVTSLCEFAVLNNYVQRFFAYERFI